MQMSTYWMNAFPNETNSLWFDSWFLPFYITCDSVHLLINFTVVIEAKKVFWRLCRGVSFHLGKFSSICRHWFFILLLIFVWIVSLEFIFSLGLVNRCSSRMFLQKAVASGGSNLARLGELGGKLFPYFPINRGRSEGERGSALLVLRNHLKLVRKIVSM